MRDPRYDCLFEPIRLGPVTAKNRFYQVPHCSGMGWQRPERLAAMRAIKAEGGWGVVCTEYCSVHPSSDDGAYPYARLWGEDNVRAQRLMTDAVHEHGALAGVELWLGGNFVANLDTRTPPLGLRSRPPTNWDAHNPVQSRRIDKADIRDLLKWQADAARRAVEAEFDIVYVYATHGYLLSEFLSPDTNDRSDEYGGALENRVRIVRELIEVTREAIGDKAALAVRFTTDLKHAETYDAFSLLAELPDLWDLTVGDYNIEMGPSRFVREAALQDSVAKAKTLTQKPVVAVGRFTSPDTMARVLREGTQDMIGAARPSIADPFLPKKIEEGRIDDIRECIGCNICYAHNTLGVPIRCTQNPSMGEELRRGWHPERVARATDRKRVLVIGAGPAGLEAARTLGAQGHEVMLAEAARKLGGRVTQESRLPGLAEWARVRDWRIGQIEKLPNVEVYRESAMAADDVREIDASLVLIATGSRWATDGIGRVRNRAIEAAADAQVLGADFILAGEETPPGSVLIYDDDHYYLGPLLALLLRSRGNAVTLLTPAGRPGEWSSHTQEIVPTIASLIEADVEIVTNRYLERAASDHAISKCLFTNREALHAADFVIPLTRREPNDRLYFALSSGLEETSARRVPMVRRIGDCEAPGLIAAAVHSGHKAAMELGE